MQFLIFDLDQFFRFVQGPRMVFHAISLMNQFWTFYRVTCVEKGEGQLVGPGFKFQPISSIWASRSQTSEWSEQFSVDFVWGWKEGGWARRRTFGGVDHEDHPGPELTNHEVLPLIFQRCTIPHVSPPVLFALLCCCFRSCFLGSVIWAHNICMMPWWALKFQM